MKFTLGGNSDEILISAARNGYIETMEKVRAKGANVNARNSVGFTALMMAIAGRYKCIGKDIADRRLDAAKWLISKDADVNARSRSWTALAWAIDGHDVDAVKVLIAGGVDINGKIFSEGITPLRYASRYRGGRSKLGQIADLLREAGEKE